VIVPRDIVLALDLGTRLGYALLREDNRIESGEARFDLKEGDGQGVRYIRFRRWLVDMKQANPGLSRLVYEKVMGHGAFQVISAHVYGGLLATLQAFGEHHRIAYDGIAVTTIKKQFAGSGKAQKVDVVLQCERMGFKPSSHNEADAIALLHVATGRAPILTMSGASPKKRPAKSRADLQPRPTP
jgi:hypothetical protein